MAEKNLLLKKLEIEEFPQPTIVRLKYPIFMCHGYGAIATVIKPGLMHDPCMFIRSLGVAAIAPNIVPYASIETRAENWAFLCRKFCEDYDYDRVNVIAHSMGGLDMRYALSKLGLADKVESLSTVSTPHHGSSLADLVLKAPEMVTEKLSWIFDWLGDNMYPKTKSDALRSVEQLTRTYVQEKFNPQVPDVDSVNYYSYSAAVGKGTKYSLNPVLKFQNNQIFEKEGPNDAFVSVESAKWGAHIETAPISHLTQMHLQVNKENQKHYEKFWLDVLKTLKAKGH
ncbi:MAG: hypothetical protein WD059_10715 [Balneolaceae bacterium]